jgi:hypothetical protein
MQDVNRGKPPPVVEFQRHLVKIVKGVTLSPYFVKCRNPQSTTGGAQDALDRHSGVRPFITGGFTARHHGKTSPLTEPRGARHQQ